MTQSFDTIKFSKSIKTKRLIEMDATLREASKKAKVSFSTLSRMENGGVPELGNFIKVCNWLNSPVSEFFIIKK
jgi:transcriptional regulator with XRE-family HTH domain